MTQFTFPEVATYWHFIEQAIDRIMATLEDRSVDELNWRPPAPETNSIHVLAVHVVGNARENILQFLCGQDVGRDRESEFKVVADETNSPLHDWPAQKVELETALRSVTSDRMNAVVEHTRRGPRSGRELLLIVATHANEHAGHAELTRDLALASSP